MQEPTQSLHSLATLHGAFVTNAAGPNREVVRESAERRPWIRAEKDALHDLATLVAACDPDPADVRDPAARLDPATLAAGLYDGLAEALADLDTDAARALAARTRTLPLRDGRPDLDALEAWLDALVESLAYGDGDGDEDSVPTAGEALLSFAEARADTRTRPATPVWADLHAQRDAATPPRDYRTDATFAEGEWLRHKTFGEGVVLDADAKIRVLFAQDTRVLIHVPERVEPHVAIASPWTERNAPKAPDATDTGRAAMPGAASRS